MSTPIDIERIRGAFPALASDTVFLENAGGSQVPRGVADRIRDYMLHTYVQLDAGYALSQASTRVVERAHRFAGTLMNVARGHVILGSSTTALLRMLSECWAEVLTPGSEIVLAECGHEANLGPWVRLEERGIEIRWWRVDPETARSPLAGLEALLGPRTAIVAFPHVSNLLGEILDIAAVVERAHAVGARVVADGVAYAPHRSIDVDAWDVDWYVYSTYKVYGPHMAVLYGRADAVAELTGPNHFFIPRDAVPYKFEPGGVSQRDARGFWRWASIYASWQPCIRRQRVPDGGTRRAMWRGRREMPGGRDPALTPPPVPPAAGRRAGAIAPRSRRRSMSCGRVSDRCRRTWSAG